MKWLWRILLLAVTTVILMEVLPPLDVVTALGLMCAALLGWGIVTGVPVRLYRTPADAVGYVYRWGHFHRWLQPRQWTLVWRGAERVGAPVSMHPRAMKMPEAQVMTAEGLPLHIALSVHYYPVATWFPAQVVSRFLRERQRAWEPQMIEALQRVTRNVMGRTPLNKLLTAHGRDRFAAEVNREGGLVLEAIGFYLMGIDFTTLDVDKQVIEALAGIQRTLRLQPLRPATLGPAPGRADPHDAVAYEQLRLILQSHHQAELYTLNDYFGRAVARSPTKGGSG